MGSFGTYFALFLPHPQPLYFPPCCAPLLLWLWVVRPSVLLPAGSSLCCYVWELHSFPHCSWCRAAVWSQLLVFLCVSFLLCGALCFGQVG